jgi:anthraniloyl-CoA monooxygenase
MKIACIGGGPAGLYFAILMKKADLRHDIAVIEKDRADRTFGWGVVFSDATLARLAREDAPIHAAIAASYRHWDRIDIHFKGEVVSCGGHGYAGIGRQRLLEILRERAAGLGVRLEFEREITDPAALADRDLIVAADGVHSALRDRHAEALGAAIDVRRNRYLWLGARRPLDAFTFAFEEAPAGWFQLHAYPHGADCSTFIVETGEASWRAAGLAEASLADSLAFCERLFADRLGGARLLANPASPRGSAWLNFRRVACARWHHGNVVLMGDAVRTAHFSIGSGTRLAMEDACELAHQLGACADIPAALAGYQRERETATLRLASAARNRMEWFEQMPRYAGFDPLTFSYTLLTGSQRIGHEELRRRDPAYVERIERRLNEATGAAPGTPPMFAPLRLRSMTLENRVVVAPMAMYACREGLPGEFHLVHLGARALGGAGLVLSEMTAPAPEARITPACAGLWSAEHARAWRRIVAFVHQNSRARIGLQLGHAGPKGSTRPPWEGEDRPLAQGNWPLLAASALPWAPGCQVPREMTRADMEEAIGQFVAAARYGAEAGFDLLELHCAHGYLLSSFLSPLTNRRRDDHGGSIENRCRFPLATLRALRAAWPADRPLAVRLSAHDWAQGGNTPADAIAIARLFKAAGADLIDVSSGQTTPAARPVYGRMYQVPLADGIRNEAGIPTIAVGSITEPDQANTIIAAGRADLCALGRPHLADPAWTLRAAAQLGYGAQGWPPPYAKGKAQLEQLEARRANRNDNS